jgi:UDPglucose 6-dehydrogenase
MSNKKSKTKITIVGSGYVGMSLSVLLSQYNDVSVLDIDPKRVSKINNHISTVKDDDIDLFISTKDLSLKATLEKENAYKDSSFIIIATPTNYDEVTNSFDTKSVDDTVKDALELNSQALVVIKSTIPIGHTKFLRNKFRTNRIIFSPEFLREGKALYDNLYPSRVIIGSNCDAGKKFADLLQAGAKKDSIETIFIESSEAEAVKLFSNAYLAMRVSFFNELDSYAMENDLNAKSIIDGVSLDSRIGSGYNNPSFGYGGYCLPKDTKQLLASFNSVPQDLIKAIVSSNETRKNYLSDEIIKKNPKSVGIYRLIMKEGSDNFRSSAIQHLINRIKSFGIKVYIYEPSIAEDSFSDIPLISDFTQFISKSDLIITNRMSKELSNVKTKVFTRDIFGEN